MTDYFDQSGGIGYIVTASGAIYQNKNTIVDCVDRVISLLLGGSIKLDYSQIAVGGLQVSHDCLPPKSRHMMVSSHRLHSLLGFLWLCEK